MRKIILIVSAFLIVGCSSTASKSEALLFDDQMNTSNVQPIAEVNKARLIDDKTKDENHDDHSEMVTKHDIQQWVIELDGTITDHNGNKLEDFNIFDPITPHDSPLMIDLKQLYDSYQMLMGDQKVPAPGPLREENAKNQISYNEFLTYRIDINEGVILNHHDASFKHLRLVDHDGKPANGGFFSQIYQMHVARSSIQACFYHDHCSEYIKHIYLNDTMMMDGIGNEDLQ